MKRILITGGPVHAYLDAVKIITNRFKGGLMCELAEDFLAYEDAQVTYLCAPKVGAQTPKTGDRLTVLAHTGLEDYRAKVLELSTKMDAVILGAAVANLIPVKPFTGKFPSHNYKPGDIIPIDFTIAPRIIDAVKRVNPYTHLFGFKLLSGVSHEELIRAAYEIVLVSGATAVFANDEKNLQQKFAVTKERGVHPLLSRELASWIWALLCDIYYCSMVAKGLPPSEAAVRKLRALIASNCDRFTKTEAGLIFGTVAVRCESGFVITGRGKRELDSIALVRSVDHIARAVILGTPQKASLNAPLLDRMFANPKVDHILHVHEQMTGLVTYPYAPPGTARDSDRPNETSFNIEGHGCILLFDSEGRQL